MNDRREGVNEAPETSLPNSTQRNGRVRIVSNDALTELAKIGAEDVGGVRVESAKVEERVEKQATVSLTVDVEYRGSLSILVDKICDEAEANIRKHLPDVETIEIKVTIASVRRLTAKKVRFRRFWGESLGSMKDALGPWIVPLLVLGFGVFVLWTITRFVNQTETSIGDVVLASLLVMPILIYAIVSGKLTELKGPGGVEAKFTAAATTPVAETASHDAVSFDELLTVPADSGQDQLDKGQEQLGKRVRRFTEVQPIVLVITIGGDNYRKGSEHKHIESLQTYVAQLSRSRNFSLVAFLDKYNNFVAYMPSWVINNRLSDDHRAKEFFDVIKQGDRQKLFEYPGILHDTISPNAPNSEALRKMLTSNLDTIVVVDENNRLKGVIEREQVVSKMVLALTPKR
jgi:CBS domain-containing protein